MSAVLGIEEIQDHLRGLDSLYDARSLFADLNYEPAMDPLPWPGDLSKAGLAEDPYIIGEVGRFKVIYSRLDSSDQLLRTKERPVIERLMREFDHKYALFLFSDDDGSHWDFVNVKDEPEGRSRRVHRRISIGPEERAHERLRTPSERLAQVALPGDKLRLLEQNPLEVQRLHDQAFDVEAVTRKFYREYAKVFEYVEKQVKGIDDPDRLRLFTQRLFNRLMFIAFIQKKGWLRLDGETDYLNALRLKYESGQRSGNFYETRLKLLFFNALDNPDIRYQERDVPGLYSIVGDVPYLNGGLFEQHEDDETTDIVVPDRAIWRILDDLFNSFNFTVTESTPLDVEVAVDPEMLGKVFEELVTGRHETGSYYTPKPVVSFMCREALKAYLTTKLPGESSEAIEMLVDEYTPDQIRDPEAVLRALQRVTACDPACGSGAYLLGLLHELLEIRGCLFRRTQIDHDRVYNRKLEIIQDNLYGVDIDPFATNIAKLRLWLSLAVDYEGEKPPPLPNLDFKIETSDSLLGRDVGAGMQLALRKKQVDAYYEYKSLYMMSHGNEKRALQREVETLRAQLSLWAHGGAEMGEGIFDWPVEFAEVFAEGGFDIVLANPPYVRQELIKEIKPELKQVYGPLYSGTADLYVYFYYRALEILKPGGALAFISSNKWFRANYGKKLRQHVADTTHVLSITDFGDLPVFESATAYPMIFIAHKGVDRDGVTTYTEVESLDDPYPDVKAVIERDGEHLPPDALAGERWLLTDEKMVSLILTMETDTIPLGKYVDGQIYYGVKTGFNEAFVIDGVKRAELIAADPRSEEIIKPLAVGRDIRRWHIRDSDQWLIFTRRGTRINDYPAIKEHLSQWKRELTPKKPSSPRSAPGRKPGSYKWYEIQDSVAYYHEFDKPKIMYPDMASGPRFSLDPTGVYSLNTTYFVVSDDAFLLAVLNSEPVLEWFLQESNQIRGGYVRFFRQHIIEIPIPRASKADCEALADLGRRCVEAAEVPEQLKDLEADINERVARLYGVRPALSPTV